jgi:dual specificity MAP kinase phosphatase
MANKIFDRVKENLELQMRIHYVLIITAVVVVIIAILHYRNHRHQHKRAALAAVSSTNCDCHTLQKQFDPSDPYAAAFAIYSELEDRIQPSNYTSPNQILPYLYVGDRADAYNNEKLVAYGITHILNMTPHEQRFCEHRDIPIIYAKMPAQDTPFFDIQQYFEPSAKFIKSAKDSGGVVLVHCNAGVSRSAIIVANYVANEFGLNARNALKFVKERRRKIRPNVGFIEQLMASHP